MTVGDASGAGSAVDPNAPKSKSNGGSNKANPAKTLRVPSPAKGIATAAGLEASAPVAQAGSALAAPATAAVAAPIEGAVSLRTVGKTVAFLAKLAAPGVGGREGDGGAFGGGGKMAGAGVAGSTYG